MTLEIHEGTRRDRKGQEGTGRDRKGQEGTGRDRKGQEGTGRDTKGQEGTRRDRKGHEGTRRGRKAATPSWRVGAISSRSKSMGRRAGAGRGVWQGRLAGAVGLKSILSVWERIGVCLDRFGRGSRAESVRRPVNRCLSSVFCKWYNSRPGMSGAAQFPRCIERAGTFHESSRASAGVLLQCGRVD